MMIPKLNSLLPIAALLLLTACEDVRFHVFCDVPSEWAATDTLEFSFVNVPNEQHSLMLDVQLRTTSSYPSRELWLAVQRSGACGVVTDTLRCEIFDSLGRQNGTGAGLYHQTSFAVGTMDVAPHDTVSIKVMHLMDEIVCGVADVGVKVCGRGRHQSSEN
ncbi:MAG: gliding motility lipoprotein GldH [Bacteroidaceae bacterium]|nr:gliding motility lipoprotein GldH [Bacteroidaceae bacterium]